MQKDEVKRQGNIYRLFQRNKTGFLSFPHINGPHSFSDTGKIKEVLYQPLANRPMYIVNRISVCAGETKRKNFSFGAIGNRTGSAPLIPASGMKRFLPVRATLRKRLIGSNRRSEPNNFFKNTHDKNG